MDDAARSDANQDAAAEGEIPGAAAPFAAGPFPRRATPAVRVGSVAEEYAFLSAYPDPSGPWTIAGQALMVGRGGPEDHLTLHSPGGDQAVVRFDVAAFYGSEARSFAAPSATLDALLARALEWLRDQEATHPGTTPRFPVPAEGYPGRVAVPMAVLAVDDRRRASLYGPTRLVVVGFPDGEPTGAADAPGFDPDRWPPPRLGPWPPPGLDGVTQAQLAGIVGRFGALWTRLLTAFFAGAGTGTGTDDPYRADEAAEALTLLARLDPPAMTGAYRRLSPRFWAWLGEDARRQTPDIRKV